MFRTEVVASKNLRKTVFYKAYNIFSIIVFVSILVLLSKVFGPETTIGQFVQNHYNDIIRPVVLILALVIFLLSTILKSGIKSPKRLGSIEIDENEIKFIIDDEVRESHQVSELSSVEFEFFSFRMRGNPMGCMNYLTLNSKSGVKTYEIVIANSMVKAELGELLATINTKVPVKVTYAYFLKKILKDNDFKF